METGDRIKKYRNRRGFTQKQLGDKIHVSSQKISNWERSYTTPDSADIKALAEALDCSVDELLGRNSTESVNIDPDFEKWLSDPKIGKFFKELAESPEEQREQLYAMWKIINRSNK
ncbi:helix-turn-helix domain-containing protein [Indiicoccus explosivorum]|uniref:helix-turn-helix domain-containing protein n=1 Tax=Indiicoccus explosivorum TaxID=1917864 RepID=UPI0013905591|nr:helix-turn-helix transcriptional regulator [Indiicoccus explosivorum]